jgi:Uncharacterized protein conserved in bacteria
MITFSPPLSMKEFLLIFRRDFINKEAQPDNKTYVAHLGRWQEWFESLAAQDRLASPPQHWDMKGKIVKANKSVTNGPYVEIKESIGGMAVIKASSYEEATVIAQGCPILELGGNVEIRKASHANEE